MTDQPNVTEEKGASASKKIVASILLLLVCLPMPIVIPLKHCGQYPSSMICSGDSIFLAPVTIITALLSIAAYCGAVLLIFRARA